MNRIAVVVITCLGMTTAFLLYLRAAERAPVAGSPGEAEIIARLDRLEQSIARLATTRAGALPAAAMPATTSSTPVTLAPPAAGGPAALDEARIAAARAPAIRAGNDIVDRALGVGQWTAEDARALAESTATLDGESAAAIHARVSAAINSDRLKFAPAALRP